MFGIHQKLDEIKKMLEQQQEGMVGLLLKYSEFESKLGIPGVMDFVNADPLAYAMPPAGHNGRSYADEYWQRKTKYVPAFRASVDKFLSFGNIPDTVLAIACVRLPFYSNSAKEGFEVSWSERSTVLTSSNHPLYVAYKPELFALHANLNIRGPFDYRSYGAVVFVFDSTEAERYLERRSDNVWFKDRVQVPSLCILDLVGGPSAEEVEMIEALLRCYWRKLQLLGYTPKWRYESLSLTKIDKNPLTGELPEALVLPHSSAAEIGLNTHWDARGFLEGWHRLCKINAILDRFEKNLPPGVLTLTTESLVSES